MVIDLFPEHVRKFFHILEDIIAIVFYAAMCIPAWQLLQLAISRGQVSPALQIPMSLIQISPLIAFFLAVIRSVQDLYFQFHGFPSEEVSQATPK